jgi:hypothetical protein
MEVTQLLSIPENRAVARAISLRATAAIAPSEATINRQFIDPLLEMFARGETLTSEIGNVSMGFGTTDLALSAVTALTVYVLGLFLSKLGEGNMETVRVRVKKDEQIKSPPRVQVVSVTSGNQAPEWIDRAELRQVLDTYFNESELRHLCFDLHIDYENLPGNGKGDKARELVAYCERHGCAFKLWNTVKKSRPHVSWTTFSAGRSETNSPLQRIPPEGLLIVPVAPQDVEKFVRGARIAKDPKKLEELSNAINDAANAVLSDYLGN